MCDKIYKNRQLSTMNRGSRFSDKCNSPVAKKSVHTEVHWLGQEGAWGQDMWVEESAKCSRAVLRGLRGPEALCWQIGDLTDCIVHTLPGHGTAFYSTLSAPPSSAVDFLGFAPSTSIIGLRPYTNQLRLSSFSPPPPLHPASRPSSSAMLSDSTFPDVRWLLHWDYHWDNKAFCCCHLAFEKLYMGEWDTITHCVGVMYRVLLRTKQWRTIIRVHILCASCQTVDRM